jgi:hypothetical protein
LIDKVRTYEWTNVTQISYLINLCGKYVFNAWYQCVKQKNYEWMNFAQFSLLNCVMLNLWWYFIPSIFWPCHGVVNKFEYHSFMSISTFTKWIFFSPKTKFILKFEIICFSIIYYEIVIWKVKLFKIWTMIIMMIFNMST